MFIFGHRSRIKNRQQISTPQIVDGEPFSTGEVQKSIIFRVSSGNFCQRGAPATPFKSATFWGPCCLKTTLVVFVAKNC